VADVLLITDDLTVLGGPQSIDVEVDFGPEGDRGSQIFVSNGKPNDVEFGQTPKVFDLCINVLSSDSEYQTVYQYQNVLGTNTWVSLFKMVSNLYSVNRTVSFLNGNASINVPVAKIVPSTLVGSVTAANFNVQFNIVQGNTPISSSMSLGEIVSQDNELVLPISLKSVEFDEGDWIDASGTKTVHLFITVV
jgi:hypothetical protein